MIKPGKTIGVKLQCLKNIVPSSSIGLESFNFSRRIVSKYVIFYRSYSIPILIFRKLSDVKNASNSLNNEKLNNQINLQVISNSTYKLKNNSIYFKNCLLQLFYTPFSYEKETPILVHKLIFSHLLKRFSFDTSMSLNADLMDTVMSSFKKTRTDLQYENNLTKLIMESKKIIIKVLNQFLLHSCNAQALVKSLIFDNLNETSNFRFLSLKHGQIVVCKNKTDDESKSARLAIQEIDSIFLRKKGNSSCYYNNLTKQIGESKKHFISYLNRYHLYLRRTLAVVDSTTLGYLQRKFSFVTSMNIKTAIQDMGTLSFKKTENDSKFEKSKCASANKETYGHLHKIFNFVFSSLQHDRVVVSTKKMDETSKNKSFTTHEIDTLPFSKIHTDSQYENNLNKPIERDKKQSIKILNQFSSHTKNILTNSLVLSCLHRELNFVTSKSIKAVIQKMRTLFFKKTKTSLNFENNLFKHNEVRKKQFITTISQYSLFTGNVLKMAGPVALKYLQRTFDFEFSSLEHGHAPVSIKKLRNALMSINTVILGVDIPSTSSLNTLTPAYAYNKTISIPSLETIQIIYSTKKIERYSLRKSINSQGTKINSEGTKINFYGTHTNSQGTHTNSQGITILLLKKVGIPKNNGDNSFGQIKEEKNKLAANLPSSYLSTKVILKSVNDVIFSYLIRMFTFDTINSKIDGVFSSTKKGRISYCIQNKRILSSTINIDKTSTLVFAVYQGVDLSSSQQTVNTQGLSFRQLFNHDINLKGQNRVSAFRNIRLSKSNNLSHDKVFTNSLMKFEHLYRFIKRSRSPIFESDSIYESRELVLKKSSPQKMETFSENKRNNQTQNPSSTEKLEVSGKPFVKEKKMHEQEIGIVAERVYKIIEKRILIEKDRRGLF